MMRLLLPLILLLLGVGGGVGAGMMLGPPGAGDAAAADDGRGDAGDQSGGDRSAEDDTAEGGQGGEGRDSGSATEYVRLNNQFVVPIVRHGSVRSLVVMSLTVEVDNGQNQAVFDREPRLRDAFLQAMFAHANAGGFDGSFTEAAAMAPLREALGDSARNVLGEVVHDVLIVDITRQDA